MYTRRRDQAHETDLSIRNNCHFYLKKKINKSSQHGLTQLSIDFLMFFLFYIHDYMKIIGFIAQTLTVSQWVRTGKGCFFKSGLPNSTIDSL